MTKTHKIILGVVALTLVSLTAAFALNSGNGKTSAIKADASPACCPHEQAKVAPCPMADTCPAAETCPKDACNNTCENDCGCCDGCKTGECACEDCKCNDCCQKAVACCCGDNCQCCEGCKGGECTCEDCKCCDCCEKVTACCEK